MHWKINIFLFFGFLFLACKENTSDSTKEKDVSTNFSEEKYTTPYLIEAEALKHKIFNPNVKILDFRKKKNYLDGHIEGARHLWRSDIEDTLGPYGGMMASKEIIERLMGRLGVKNIDTLVIYDDRGSCDAVRLWWILQNYDFHNVKILNGGIDAWKAMKEKVDTVVTIIEPTVFKLAEVASNNMLATKEEVIHAASLSSNTMILDTRTRDEYSGKRQKKGASKGGRIPSSRFINWEDAVNFDDQKKLKSIEELQYIYGQLDLAKSDTVIVYCHSGVRSAHTTFVLKELLGYKNVKNYDGSWIEWSYFDELPFEQDSETLIKN